MNRNGVQWLSEREGEEAATREREKERKREREREREREDAWDEGDG
jgi:hypothetical protein